MLNPKTATYEDIERALQQEPLPDGAIVIDRARFERVLEYVVASEHMATFHKSLGRKYRHEDLAAAHSRSIAARRALQPGDLDPLP